MYAGRFNIFVCNGCGLQVATKTFPEGFIFFPNKGETQHFCSTCQTPEQVKAMETSISNRTAPMVEKSPVFVVSTPMDKLEETD